MPSSEHYNSQARLRLTVSRPSREQGLKLSSCWLTPELLVALAQLSQDQDISCLDQDIQRQLRELGLIVPADQLSDTVFFRPVFDLLWPALIPLNQRLQAVTNALKLHPAFSLATPTPPQWPSDLLPPGVQPLWLPSRWQQDLLLPFCPSDQLLAILRALTEGVCSVAELQPELRDLLVVAGILIPEQITEARLQADFVAAWAQTLAAGRVSLQQQGFAVIRGLVNPLQIAALRDYLRELSPAGYFERDLQQVEQRGFIQNHPLMQFLHLQLAPLLQALTGEELIPSYSMLAIYPGGSELHPHRDRSQCVWNASLLLDSEPETCRADAWPLWIEYAGKVRPALLEMGDLVLYKGTETTHARPPLPIDHQVGVGLFHFVSPRFVGALD